MARRTRWVGGVVALLASAGLAHATPPADGPIRCTVDTSAGRKVWDVELDARAGRARIDGIAAEAAFSSSHARLRREDGTTITIGRRSGRLVVVADDGRLIGRGQCERPISL